VVIDPTSDPGGLLIRERPPRAHGAPGPIAGDRLRTAGGVSRPPAADRLARCSAQVGDVGFGESQFTAARGSEAQRLEDLIGQLASVWQGGSHGENALFFEEVETPRIALKRQ
jgi:hypothetical protein